MGEKHAMLKKVVTDFEGIMAILGIDASASESAQAGVVKLIYDYYNKAYEASMNNEPVAWINFGVPPELFWAMDIVPLVVDSVAGTLAAHQDIIIKYVDCAHEHIPDFICANNKIMLGAAFAGELAPPSILVHPSSPCDSNLATYPVVADYFGFPYFCIDMPYLLENDLNDEGLEYMTGEMKRLVSMLEEITGKKLDYDKLKQVIECSNRSHELVLKIAKLRENVPCPYSSIDALAETGLAMCVMGTPGVLEYYEKQYEKTKQMVADSQGYMTKEEEKHRVVWIYGAPVFDYSLYSYLENEYGAVSVGNMSNNLVMEPVEDISDTHQILKGLAKKTTKLPMVRECGGTWERYLDAAIDLCSRFSADAAVFGGHVACKANWAIAKMVKDKIQEKLGIPTLNLELDLFDQRITSSDDVKKLFDNFFEVNFPQ